MRLERGVSVSGVPIPESSLKRRFMVRSVALLRDASFSVKLTDRPDYASLVRLGQVVVERQSEQTVAHILGYRTPALSAAVALSHVGKV